MTLGKGNVGFGTRCGAEPLAASERHATASRDVAQMVPDLLVRMRPLAPGIGTVVAASGSVPSDGQVAPSMRAECKKRSQSS